MKKLFDTNENIADKAFTQSIVISVVGILLCIVALCSATYAWFVADISSQSTLSAACFDWDVQIFEITPAADGQEATRTGVAAKDRGAFDLTAGKQYEVMVYLTSKNTATRGSCDLTFKYTQQGSTAQTTYRANLAQDAGVVTFMLETNVDTELTTTAIWGIPADNSVKEVDPKVTIGNSTGSTSTEGTTETNTETNAETNTEGGSAENTTTEGEPNAAEGDNT